MYDTGPISANTPLQGVGGSAAPLFSGDGFDILAGCPSSDEVTVTLAFTGGNHNYANWTLRDDTSGAADNGYAYDVGESSLATPPAVGEGYSLGITNSPDQWNGLLTIRTVQNQLTFVQLWAAGGLQDQNGNSSTDTCDVGVAVSSGA